MLIIAKIKQTCFACPSQWEGTTEDGKDVYIRFRWGCLRMDINGETVAEMDVGEDGMSGCMDLDQALDNLKTYISISPQAMEEYCG
jgi:hypothetical protein